MIFNEPSHCGEQRFLWFFLFRKKKEQVVFPKEALTALESSFTQKESTKHPPPINQSASISIFRLPP
jgi:hypothetical protein